MMKNRMKLSNDDFSVVVFEIQEEDINFDTRRPRLEGKGMFIEVFGSKKFTANKESWYLESIGLDP